MEFTLKTRALLHDIPNVMMSHPGEVCNIPLWWGRGSPRHAGPGNSLPRALQNLELALSGINIPCEVYITLWAHTTGKVVEKGFIVVHAPGTLRPLPSAVPDLLHKVIAAVATLNSKSVGRDGGGG